MRHLVRTLVVALLLLPALVVPTGADEIEEGRELFKSRVTDPIFKLNIYDRAIVDVLISQQVLFQAQRDYARARHDYLLNSLRLKQAAGTITVADLQAVNALLK